MYFHFELFRRQTQPRTRQEEHYFALKTSAAIAIMTYPEIKM